MKDPYQILGVSKTAGQDELRTAYRNQAKKLHPDLNPGNKEAEAKFKDLSAAYEKIGTAEERAKFDRGDTAEQQQEKQQEQQRQYYHQTQQGGGRYSSSFGADIGGDDFFENLFRSAGGARGAGALARPTDFPGEDQLYQMSVDFKDAVLGAEREITLPQGKKLQIRIPPGVETGTRMRFKGQGQPGVGTGPPGDAYVEITVRSLAGFRRVGSNIETEVAVSFLEALLGAEVPVPTVDGSVTLTVPSGVTTGSRLRIRGKGVALQRGTGDQIVVIKIVMPKKPSTELLDAVRVLAEKHSYDPRTPS